MDRTIFSLIIINVLMTSFAQVVLKAGMSTQSVVHSLAEGFRFSATISIFTSPMVIFGLMMYFSSAVIWLLVLSRIEVSLAYPFVGLGFIITMILGWLIHGDSLTIERILGTLLITCGVIVLARS